MTVFQEGNRHVVDFIHGLSLKTVPADVVEQAKVCLLDLTGACIAGRHAKGAAILLDLILEQFGGVAEATVIGASRKVSCVSAALVNGFIVNALDIDDGHRLCKGHPGAVIFPAILAAAEKTGADGKSVLEALIVGYEIAIRAGLILHGHYGYYHGSGAWGAIGAAAAAARLLYLNREQFLNALGIAESHAPLTPVMRSVVSPAMAPKDGVAWGAMAGASAALLARRGYTGSPSVLGDPAYNRDVFTLGRAWRIMEIYFKPYPCCRWTQPSVEAVLNLLKNADIRREEISRIVIYTFAEAAALSGEIPRDLESAEYNIRFPVAAAIVHGEFTPALLAENHFRNDALLDILKLIETRIDPEIQNQFPQKCLSRVEIHTKSGRVADSGLIPARGDRDGVPLSRDELETKFFNITKGILAPDCALSLVKIIRNLENHHISDIIPYLA